MRLFFSHFQWQAEDIVHLIDGFVGCLMVPIKKNGRKLVIEWKLKSLRDVQQLAKVQYHGLPQRYHMLSNMLKFSFTFRRRNATNSMTHFCYSHNKKKHNTIPIWRIKKGTKASSLSRFFEWFRSCWRNNCHNSDLSEENPKHEWRKKGDFVVRKEIEAFTNKSQKSVSYLNGAL